MKYIHKFDTYHNLNESQTKKLKKYFTFSVVLEWYRKNKEMIAKTLGCEVSDLADEDTLMEQSYGVVNYVINPQTDGNEGRDAIDIAGFSKFNKLEKNLIHDILHNMYQVQSKEFNKSLERIEYTESEIFEEIEVLGIEESFMKNMNIPYPKTDFINQNLNMLASYMMMSILKNDPERIKKILDEEVEPYLEIYGKQYPVEGTPYENFFKLFQNTAADSNFEISDANDFKEYMIRLINVGRGIGEKGGDRAQYPDSSYFGDKDWDDLTDDEMKDSIKWNFPREKKYQKENYILVISDFVGTIDDLEKLGLRLNVLGEETSHEVNDPNQLKLFPEYEKELDAKKKATKKPSPYTGKESLSEADSLSQIIIKREFIDEDGYVDMNKWFSFLENVYKITLYELNDEKYLGVKHDLETDKFSILDEEAFREDVRDEFESGERESLDTDTEFINFDKYRQKSFAELAQEVMGDDDSRAILRRNFRTNDVIKNNTKLGNLYTYYWKQDEVETKNPAHNYVDFKKSDFAGEKSISKSLLTDNGKRLIYLLNNLKGYFLKNIEKIKANYKSKNTKFGNDIEKYRNINLNSLKSMLDIVSKMDFEKDTINLKCVLGYGWSYKKELSIRSNSEIDTIEKFFHDFKAIKDFKDKVKTKEDVEFLMNYVNERGLLRTPKDFTKFKTFITKLRKYEKKIDNYPFIHVVNFLKTHKTININNDEVETIKKYLEPYNHSGKDVKDVGMENDKTLNTYISNIIKKYLGELQIKSFTITEVEAFDIVFTITI